MSVGEILMAAGAALLISAGLWLIARNRTAGESLARFENEATRGSSLLNAERVERIQASVDNPHTRVLDRGKAVFLSVWLIVVGTALLAQAF